MKTNRKLLSILAVFAVLVLASLCAVPVKAASSAFTIKSLKQTDSGIYVKWSGKSSNGNDTVVQMSYDSSFSDEDDFACSSYCDADTTSVTLIPYGASDGDIIYVRVGDGEDTWSSTKKLTIKADYTYEVEVVNPYCEIYTDNSWVNILIFIKTENPDTDNIVIDIEASSGEEVNTSRYYQWGGNQYPDLAGIGDQDSYGFYPVSGGYLCEISVDIPGKMLITVSENTFSYSSYWNTKNIECDSTWVYVQDYDTAHDAWVDSMAEDCAQLITSDMTTAEIIYAVRDYIYDNYSYKTMADDEYVYLYTENGTAWQKKQLDSLSAPSAALSILEELGVTDVSSGYAASGYDWNYHATVVDADGNYYTICPGGGEIDLDDVETIYLTKVSETHGYHSYGSGSGTVTCSRCSNKALSLSSAAVTLSKTSYTYTGSAKKPSVTVTYKGTKLKKGTDYTVTYSSNTKAGTAKVTIRGIGTYGGTVKETFTIKAKSIKKATATLSTTKYTYNGKARKPSVTVKLTVNGTEKTLKKGTDYTVSYSSGRTKVGKYTVTIKGKGNYSGTITKTFKIIPKKVTLKSSTKSSSSQKLTVKWSKLTSGTVTKYQIRYRYKTSSGYSAWKTKSVSASKSSYTLSSLKSGKKYQVQVRAYKTVDGTKYYGKWSKTKTVKVK